MIDASNKLGYGLFMIVENVIILALILDLIYRTTVKIKKVKHLHVTWMGGLVFLTYLLFIFLQNVAQGYLGFQNYIIDTSPVSLYSVVARVVERSLGLIAKIFLWYYTVNYRFELFSRNK